MSSTTEGPVCPICLEGLSEPPGDNGSNHHQHKIAATVPCGHLFHQICISKWHYSGSHVKNCPTCNLPFTGIVSLFLDPSIFRGLGDDDISISSDFMEMEETKSVDPADIQLEEDSQNDATSKDLEQEEVTESDEVPEETSGSRNFAASDYSGPTITNPSTDITDAFEPPKTKRSINISQNGPIRLRGAIRNQVNIRTVSASSSKINDNDGKSSATNMSSSEERRLLNIAKYYKRHYLRKLSEHERQLVRIDKDEERILLLESTTIELKSEMRKILETTVTYERKIALGRHELEKVKIERTHLKRKCDLLEMERDSATAQLDKLQSCYVKDLEDASGRSMHEVRQMSRRLREVEEKYRSLVRSSTSSLDNRKKRNAKDMEKMVRDFDHGVQSQKKSANKENSAQSRPSGKGKSNCDANDLIFERKVDSTRYSSVTARLVVASSQQKERKSALKSAPLEEIFEVEPPHRNSKTKPKRSTEVFKSSLSLFQQKRTKRCSGSWDFCI